METQRSDNNDFQKILDITRNVMCQPDSTRQLFFPDKIQKILQSQVMIFSKTCWYP